MKIKHKYLETQTGHLQMITHLQSYIRAFADKGADDHTPLLQRKVLGISTRLIHMKYKLNRNIITTS